MPTRSFADAHISAAHRSHDGQMHGHTWRVRAFWEYVGESIVLLKATLQSQCGELDHSILPDELRRAEDIAAHIGKRVNAVEVWVWRDAEGMGAEWTP